MSIKDRFTNSTVELEPKKTPPKPSYKWPCAQATLDALDGKATPMTEKQTQAVVLAVLPETHPFHVTCALLELQHKGLVTKLHGRFVRCR